MKKPDSTSTVAIEADAPAAAVQAGSDDFVFFPAAFLLHNSSFDLILQLI